MYYGSDIEAVDLWGASIKQLTARPSPTAASETLRRFYSNATILVPIGSELGSLCRPISKSELGADVLSNGRTVSRICGVYPVTLGCAGAHPGTSLHRQAFPDFCSRSSGFGSGLEFPGVHRELPDFVQIFRTESGGSRPPGKYLIKPGLAWEPLTGSKTRRSVPEARGPDP